MANGARERASRAPGNFFFSFFTIFSTKYLQVDYNDKRPPTVTTPQDSDVGEGSSPGTFIFLFLFLY